jgi:hypothetical protein
MQMLLLNNIGNTLRIVAIVTLFFVFFLCLRGIAPEVLVETVLGCSFLLVAGQFAAVTGERFKEPSVAETKPERRPGMLTVISILMAIAALASLTAFVVLVSSEYPPDLFRKLTLFGMQLPRSMAATYLIVFALFQGYVTYLIWNLRLRGWTLGVGILYYGILNSFTSAPEVFSQVTREGQPVLLVLSPLGFLANFLILAYLVKNKTLFAK